MRQRRWRATIDLRINRGVDSLLVVCATGALTVASLGGCATDHRGEEQLVRITTRSFLVALARGDGRSACALVSQSGRRRIAAEAGTLNLSCAQAISIAARNLPSTAKRALATARVGGVTIDGDRATVPDANVTSTDGDLSPYLRRGASATHLVRVGGRWVLSE